MYAGGVGMLKQWQIVLYVVTATLVVATANQALADESSDGWRPKSSSRAEDVLSGQQEEMLQLVPGEINQAGADDGSKEEPFDWMDERYGPQGATSQGTSNTVGANEVVMMASQAHHHLAFRIHRRAHVTDGVRANSDVPVNSAAFISQASQCIRLIRRSQQEDTSI